jgi:C4-dicarboxylate-binding protein DctP
MRYLLAGLAALALTVPALAQQPIVIKFSHVVAVDTPKGKGAEMFKKLAEERTHGRVKVEVYPNSSLFKDGEEMEALQLGSVQLLAPSLAKFGPLGVRDFEVFDLPYLFDSYDDLHKVTEGPVGQMLFKKLESKGIVGLAYWDNGFKDMSANKPIKLPADYKGLKMRIQSSKVLGDQMKALGSIPQVMAFSEVYQALQTGVVDGTQNPPSNFYTQKMHEVHKKLALTNHGYLGYAVIVNKKFWDGLPADIRTALDGAMKDATKFANDIAKKENEDALEAVRKSGRTQILTPTAEERMAMKKALLPVHKENESRVGKATIEAVYKATGYKPYFAARAGRPPAAQGRLREVPGSPRGVAHRLPHGRGHPRHFRRRGAPVCRRHAHSLRAGLAAHPRPVVGAGAVHLHVRVDGQVRRGVRRAHRHPRRRGRDDQPAAAARARGVRDRRPARRRAVHGHRRHAGRNLRVGHRAHQQRVARPRAAQVDRVPVRAARLVAHVLPLPPGRVGVRTHRRAPAA